MRVAQPVVVSEEVRRKLDQQSRGRSTQARVVLRSRIVLLAADGLTNQQIAMSTGYARWTVTTWRQRFAKDRLAGLQDKPRSGRPPAFSPGAAASDDRPGL